MRGAYSFRVASCQPLGQETCAPPSCPSSIEARWQAPPPLPFRLSLRRTENVLRTP